MQNHRNDPYIKSLKKIPLTLFKGLLCSAFVFWLHSSCSDLKSFMCLLKTAADSFCFNEAETDYKGVSDFDEFRFTVETLM